MNGTRLDLGVGLVGLHGVDLIWPGIADLVDVVEVEPQTLWTQQRGGGWHVRESAFSWFARLGVPLLCHGVGFPVGGMEPPDDAGVKLAAESARRLGAAHWSEHLSFNMARRDGEAFEAGYLLPPRQTWATVDAAVANISRYQAQLDLPFLVETGTNYLRAMPGELSDGEFITEVVERADCGILLDLHNLWANERNGRQPIADVLAGIPLERVLEVHLAGGFEVNGYYLDAHLGVVAPELLEIARDVLPAMPNVRAVLFEALPESLVTLGAPGVRAVLEQLHRLVDGATPHADQPPSVPRTPSHHVSVEERAAQAEWEAAVLLYVSRGRSGPPTDDAGFDMIRELTDQARLSRVVQSRPDLVRPLFERYGRDGARAFVERFLEEQPARFGVRAEGDSFAEWLALTGSC